MLSLLNLCAHLEIPRKWLSWEDPSFHGRNSVDSLDMREALGLRA